jgi:IS5 family transposase
LDQSAKYQITDRLSFQRFLGIASVRGIPDEKTIWAFRDQLKEAGLVDQLFDEFVSRLRGHDLLVNKGKLVDASIVNVPR